jgi:hypothetical protein
MVKINIAAINALTYFSDKRNVGIPEESSATGFLNSFFSSRICNARQFLNHHQSRKGNGQKLGKQMIYKHIKN